MIREKTYYLTTLLLPIVLSLLSLACAQFGVLRELPHFFACDDDSWRPTVFIDAAGTWFFFFRLNDDKFVFYCHFAPFLMALAFAVCSTAAVLIDNGRATISDILNVILIGGLYSLIVGYFYILLAAIIYKLLKSPKLRCTEPHRAFYE